MKSKDKLVGKIGVCKNKDLGIKKIPDGIHYVYIRKVNNDNTCDVNTFTQLTKHYNNDIFDYEKMYRVRKGDTYLIPDKDVTLPNLSGVTKDVIKNVPIDKIHNVGCHSIKKRHHFYIKKFMKKD